MTTFTTEDRILAEKNGSFTVNVEPIPFAGWINTSPPHIVNSGASVMIKELTDEQILEIWRENERSYPMDINKLLDRSRAILRKAQEK
ncbi:MAG: hypothetical protein AN484_16825 [Aphanizomenon flos-aquae WA102]|uniref:Uncharacterized protein n=1 Tax=Aphanizomenon flos-aquae WA102 TaxID=1710896 RepID=A0A1B7WZN9_APHFL|nr:MAG: hypothetical protein AN484_16825 [Aphanizomenon flos-aquae WA102]